MPADESGPGRRHADQGELDTGDVGDEGIGAQPAQGLQVALQGAGEDHQLGVADSVAHRVGGSVGGVALGRQLQRRWRGIPSHSRPALVVEGETHGRTYEPGSDDGDGGHAQCRYASRMMS